MAITGFPTGITITPTKPKFTNSFVPIAVSGTYYTALDITSGTGLISGIRVGNASADNFKIKITIDDNTAEELILNDHARDSIATTASGTYVSVLNTFVYFKKSCLIEVTNTTDTSSVYVLIDYALI
jgi:hypothetical protein